jgi:DNA mismatch repair protein MSH6
VPTFIPNDISFSKNIKVLLITGPNMGGKSTILRQACIAIILAQIGSYVPAKSFVLNPFDRIFCRIGANDKILEGKSTFFMEMEESGTIIKEATEDSFVIFDELGRGTSTYDGVSLAYSVLKYVVENIQCKTMFSTHYHLLVDEFKLFESVRKYYMDFRYNEKNEEIDFFYKFVEGEACKSFGLNVAKIVGVPKEVLEIAQVKAQTLNAELANLQGMKNINEKFNECLKFVNNE